MRQGLQSTRGPAPPSTGRRHKGDFFWGAHSIVIRFSIPNRPGMLAQVASAIAAAGGNIGAIDTPEITHEAVIRDITIAVSDGQHGQRVVEAASQVPGGRVINVSKPIFLAPL